MSKRSRPLSLARCLVTGAGAWLALMGSVGCHQAQPTSAGAPDEGGTEVIGGEAAEPSKPSEGDASREQGAPSSELDTPDVGQVAPVKPPPRPATKYGGPRPR